MNTVLATRLEQNSPGHTRARSKEDWLMQKKCNSMTGPLTENQETIPLIRPERWMAVPGVQFFFTTRRGGVSQGRYASLNLGGHVGDDPGAVACNRARVEAIWAGRIQQVCYLNQVHGTTTVEAGNWSPSTPPDADAQVTRQPGLVLAILTADCAPVLLADGTARVIGAAHAGWRGGLSGVLESCLEAMLRLGAHRERIHALIGPCIRQSAYVVDETFQAAFITHAEKNALDCKKFFSKQNNAGRLHFDLPGYLQARLKSCGLSEERIHDAELCTYSKNNDFFSHRHATHRGLAPCGRQIGGLFLV
ncbi:MAG: peptidoglycan editing factor PgeF [Magnetococcales bacterium]|nr:peptidoglycan editing factor PgeF [Magnetococcales bacterium]